MKFKIFVSIFAAFCIIILSTVIGSVKIPYTDVLSIILYKLLNINLPTHIDNTTVSILWTLRIPRTLLAFLVGSALSVSGAVMQSVLKNPLASSYTLGVSSGAAFGAGLVIVFNISLPILKTFTLPVFGLLFALLTVFLSISFSSKVDKNMSTNTIVLTGMIFSLFINSLITLIMSTNKDHAQKLVFWQMGSFASKDISSVILLSPIVFLGFFILMNFTRELDILTFGEEQALSMGVNVRKVKWLFISIAAIITGSAVSFAGIIGFIDLFTPHIVRKIFGSSHKYVLPLSFIFGGCFMVISDLIARTIVSPSELPVGAVTAILGTPFFAYVYIRNSKSRKN